MLVEDTPSSEDVPLLEKLAREEEKIKRMGKLRESRGLLPEAHPSDFYRFLPNTYKVHEFDKS